MESSGYDKSKLIKLFGEILELYTLITPVQPKELNAQVNALDGIFQTESELKSFLDLNLEKYADKSYYEIKGSADIIHAKKFATMYYFLFDKLSSVLKLEWKKCWQIFLFPPSVAIPKNSVEALTDFLINNELSNESIANTILMSNYIEGNYFIFFIVIFFLFFKEEMHTIILLSGLNIFHSIIRSEKSHAVFVNNTAKILFCLYILSSPNVKAKLNLHLLANLDNVDFCLCDTLDFSVTKSYEKRIIKMYYESLTNFLLTKKVDCITYIIDDGKDDVLNDKTLLDVFAKMKVFPQSIGVHKKCSKKITKEDCFLLALQCNQLYQHALYSKQNILVSYTYEPLQSTDSSQKVLKVVNSNKKRQLILFFEDTFCKDFKVVYEKEILSFLTSLNTEYEELVIQQENKGNYLLQQSEDAKTEEILFYSILRSMWLTSSKKSIVVPSKHTMKIFSFLHLAKDEYSFSWKSSQNKKFDTILQSLTLLFHEVFLEDMDKEKKENEHLHFEERSMTKNIFYYYRSANSSQNEVNIYINSLMNLQLDEYFTTLCDVCRYFYNESAPVIIVYFTVNFVTKYKDSKEFIQNVLTVLDLCGKIQIINNQEILNCISVFHVSKLEFQLVIRKDLKKAKIENFIYEDNYVLLSFFLSNFSFFSINFFLISHNKCKAYIIDREEFSYSTVKLTDFKFCDYPRVTERFQNHQEAVMRFMIRDFEGTVKLIDQIVALILHFRKTHETKGERKRMSLVMGILAYNIKEGNPVIINSERHVIKLCTKFSLFDRIFFPVNHLISFLPFVGKVVEHFQKNPQCLVFNKFSIFSGTTLPQSLSHSSSSAISSTINAFQDNVNYYTYQVEDLISSSVQQSQVTLTSKSVHLSFYQFYFCLLKKFPKLKKNPILFLLVQLFGKRKSMVAIYQISKDAIKSKGNEKKCNIY